jgi:cytoskeletal protein CcmA (bactofilin family)
MTLCANKRGPQSRGLLIHLALVTLGLLGGVIVPLHAEERNFGKDVTLTGSHSNAQFLVGRSVRISAEVEDDVFAGGRSVTFDGAKVENAIVAGNAVTFERSTARDMIALAGRMTLAGEVQDDLVAAARWLRIVKDGSIGGDARLAARDIDIEGKIGGSVRAVARRITISGTIDGKADLMAERIVIASGARIAGDLIYRSEDRPEIADGASIGGTVQQMKPDFPIVRKIGWALLGVGLAFALACAFGVLVLGAVVQLLAPRLIEVAAARVRLDPWVMLGRGVALLLLVPVAAVLLLATLIGIPVGLFLLLTFWLLLALGLVATAYSMGLWLKDRLGRPKLPDMGARIFWTLAGLVIVGAVTLVPFLGMVVALLAVAAGLGAVATITWSLVRPGQEAVPS